MDQRTNGRYCCLWMETVRGPETALLQCLCLTVVVDAVVMCFSLCDVFILNFLNCSVMWYTQTLLFDPMITISLFLLCIYVMTLSYDFIFILCLKVDRLTAML